MIRRKKTETEIKKIVDDIFEKFSEEPEDNMIVLSSCNYYDEDRQCGDHKEPLIKINFDGYGHKYNKLAYPIGRYYDLSGYNNKGNKEDDQKHKELMTEAQKIINYFDDLGLSDIYDYWTENNEAINECWYGVHAITKDYQIVAFVIRDDGMLCDEDSFNSFNNKILYTIQ